MTGAGIPPALALSLAHKAQAAGFRARALAPAEATGFRRLDRPAAPESQLAPEPAPPIPAPVPQDLEHLHRQALAAARAEGRAEGHAAGLAQGADEGFQRGLAEGRVLGRAEAEAALAPDARLLHGLLARLADPGVVDPGALVPAITEAVRTLATERAGRAIDDMPGPFAARIAALADRLARAGTELRVALNPDDHVALGRLGALPEGLAGARLVTDPAMQRGDLALRAGGARMEDRP